MDLSIKDYMNMGMEAVATSPGEIIHHLNTLGKGSKAQIACINKLVKYFDIHKTDRERSNDYLDHYVSNWFLDHDITTVESALHDKSRDSEWKSPQMRKGLKKLSVQGYDYVCGPYAMGDSTATYPAPVGYKMMTRFLWDLDEKQDAIEEMEDM